MSKLKLFLFVFSLLLCSDLSLRADESAVTAEKTKSSFSNYYKKLKYEASLAYTKYSAGDSWWNKIEPYNIYLGALPLQNKGHLEAILELGVTHVLSMVEDFEVEDGWFNTPVKQETWQQQGIIVKHIQAEDFLPLSHAQLEEGIEYLAKTLEEGNSVYVHCKAGRGRSASVVIGYLMKYQQLSFADSFDLVKKQRPQINLNEQQKEAIVSFFVQDVSVQDPVVKATLSGGIYGLLYNMNDLSEEGLAKLLDGLLYYVIEGMECHTAHLTPDSLSVWMPSIGIDSTLARRNRYLREFHGDQNAATAAAIERNHGLVRKIKTLGTGLIPFVGAPTSYTVALWHQLREITLIAAMHGHDIYDPEVRMKIYSCLIGGDLIKVPAHSVKYVARQIVKKVAPRAAIVWGKAVVVPAGFIFDYFSDRAAYVATHAKQMFAGKHSLPVNQEAYAE